MDNKGTILSREQLLNFESAHHNNNSGIKLDALLADSSLLTQDQIANLLSAYSIQPLTLTVDISEPIEGIFDVTLTNGPSDLAIQDITVVNGTAENLYTVDNSTYTFNVIPDGGGDVQISIPGSNTLIVSVNEDWAFLSNPSTSHVYYDFRELVGDAQAAVLVTDPALVDLSGNERTASIIGIPLIQRRTGVIALDDFSTNCLSVGDSGFGGGGFLQGDFSVNFALRSTDGQPTSGYHLCGNQDADGDIFDILFSAEGKLQIRYGGFTWLSTDACMIDGATGTEYFSVHFDFTNDTLTAYQNGVAVPGSFTVSNISSVDPSAFDVGVDLYVGSRNTDGTASTNVNQNDVFYFAITTLQSDNHAAINTYLTNRKPTFELIDVLEDATYLKNPHDVIIDSFDSTKAYVSGKGDDSLETVDGSFAVVDISDPENISLLGGYANEGDQLDGETVLQLSSTRVLHFVESAALLFDVSNSASPEKIRTVANSDGVVNGAVQIGNYIFGANKGGFIDVFDVSDIDNFTLVGSYDTTGENFSGPHDIDVTDDNEHIVFVSRTNDPDSVNHFGIIKVMNAGILIPIGSWSILGSLDDESLSHSNRVRVLRGKNHAVISGNPNISTIDISTLSAPSISDQFANTTFSSGLHRYRNMYIIPSWQVGLRLLNINDPSNIIQNGGFYNDVDFTPGNASFHDMKTFKVAGKVYVLVSIQAENKVGVWRINRF